MAWKDTNDKSVNLVRNLPSSMSGGNPPTKTFLEYRSSESASDFGELFKDEPKDGTVWSIKTSKYDVVHTKN